MLTPGCVSWAKMLCHITIHRHGQHALVLTTATNLLVHLRFALQHTKHTIILEILVTYAQTACQCRSLSVKQELCLSSTSAHGCSKAWSHERQVAPIHLQATDSTMLNLQTTVEKCTNQGQAATSGSQVWIPYNAARNSGVFCRAWLLPGDQTPNGLSSALLRVSPPRTCQKHLKARHI